MTAPASSIDSARGTVGSPLSGEGRDSGVFQTSPGLLRRIALAQWSEGLAQYLAIRIGDAARGRRAYAQLARMVKNLPPSELLEGSGPKAQLYRMARTVAEVERRTPPQLEGGELPWRAPEGRLGKAIARLRDALGEDDAELLELRHARELSVEDIACVVERAPDEVELALDTAEARARKLLGKDAPDPLRARATAYVQAFALARSWREAPLELTESRKLALAEPEDEALEPGALIGGRYEIIEHVGTGAFGDVYRAEDIEVRGHEVALKLLRQPSLSEHARRSALRELKLNAAVFHPSLVQFKDHGWYEDRLWFVMPWYQGETLEAAMRGGGLSRKEARRIFEPLTRALAALHESGIRHQDIKPENILLTRLPGGEDQILPVLIDLGVAAEEQETLLGGTPLYFAPEVAARFVGDGDHLPEVDRAADVFALALSLRNALEPDTQDDVPAGAIQAFVERRAREMPPLPMQRDLRYLRPTFERWLSPDPLERPSALELAEELAILTAPEERRARRWKLFRWLAPLLVTLAVAFAAVVSFLSERAERERVRAVEAQRETSDVRADLMVENARREALEEGHAALLGRYEQSRLTRTQLAGELATVEGQVRIVRRDLSDALRQREQLEQQLGAATTRATRTAEELAENRATLATTERRADALDRDLRALRARADDLASQLGDATDERDTLRRQLAAATRDLATARTAEQRERDRADALEAETQDAREARRHAEDELARVRARIAALASAMREPDPSEAPVSPTPEALP